MVKPEHYSSQSIDKPISKRGKLRFMLNKDSMNADKLIDFMTRLPTDSKKKAFLVPDNLRVHHAKKITAWLEEHKDQQRIRVKQPAPAENKEFAALVEQYMNISMSFADSLRGMPL